MASRLRVAVLHAHAGGQRMWDHLDRNWALHGRVALSVVQYRSFNLQLLLQSLPDVVVIADVAGAPYQLTDEEVSAITRYAAGGVNRHLLATYAAFYHEEGADDRHHIYDNRRLAPLFGLDPDASYTTRRLAAPPAYTPTRAVPLLWRGIDGPFVSKGYSSTQIPTHSQTWVDGEKLVASVGDVEVLAQTSDGQCVVVNHRTDRYTSLFVSSMPEYDSLKGSLVDAQFLYNAIVFLASQNTETPLTTLCMDRLLAAAAPWGAAAALPLPLRLLRGSFVVARTEPEACPNP